MIGLHIDDQPVLEFIQSNLKCGRIEQNKEKTIKEEGIYPHNYFYHTPVLSPPGTVSSILPSVGGGKIRIFEKDKEQ